MVSWTAGYVSDIPYASSFHRHMTPAHLRYAALSLGYRMNAPSSYLELGSGPGFGLTLMAAAEPDIRFHGVDFNPEHIVASRRLAASAALDNVEFEEAGFEEMAGRGKTDVYDCVALHGVMSWVSPATQAAIVGILGQSLTAGGLAYLSYNSMPGWAVAVPMQFMLRTLARRAPSGRSDAGIDHALKAMDDLQRGNALYFMANPEVQARLERMPGLSRAYLAHEYLNEHWRPLHFAEVAGMLEPAKLGFMGSASLLDDIDAVAVPESLQELVSAGDLDVVFRETLRDYAANKQFRRDIFARGLPLLNTIQHNAILDASAFVLAGSGTSFEAKFPGPIGDIEGAPEVYEPLVRRLEEADIATFAELAALPALAERGRGVTLQALTILVASGVICPVAPGDRSAARRSCSRFNRLVTSSLADGQSFSQLASPVAGSGIHVSTAELLVLSAIHAGCTDDDSLARHVLPLLRLWDRSPARDGVPIEDENEALDQVASDLGPLAASKVPVWQRLGIL